MDVFADMPGTLIGRIHEGQVLRFMSKDVFLGEVRGGRYSRFNWHNIGDCEKAHQKIMEHIHERFFEEGVHTERFCMKNVLGARFVCEDVSDEYSFVLSLKEKRFHFSKTFIKYHATNTIGCAHLLYEDGEGMNRSRHFGFDARAM
jgi:hypothetical protein